MQNDFAFVLQVELMLRDFQNQLTQTREWENEAASFTTMHEQVLTDDDGSCDTNLNFSG